MYFSFNCLRLLLRASEQAVMQRCEVRSLTSLALPSLFPMLAALGLVTDASQQLKKQLLLPCFRPNPASKRSKPAHKPVLLPLPSAEQWQSLIGGGGEDGARSPSRLHFSWHAFRARPSSPWWPRRPLTRRCPPHCLTCAAALRH